MIANHQETSDVHAWLPPHPIAAHTRRLLRRLFRLGFCVTQLFLLSLRAVAVFTWLFLCFAEGLCKKTLHGLAPLDRPSEALFLKIIAVVARFTFFLAFCTGLHGGLFPTPNAKQHAPRTHRPRSAWALHTLRAPLARHRRAACAWTPRACMHAPPRHASPLSRINHERLAAPAFCCAATPPSCQARRRGRRRR